MHIITLDGNIEVVVPNNYVIESMLFNPRLENSKYLIKPHDQYLIVNLLGSYMWTSVNSCDVGRNFKDILVERPDIILLAIPLKYEFDNDSLFHASAYFNWSALGSGSGQLNFSFDKERKKVVFDTEMLGPEKTRKLLHDFVDHIIDTGYSEDWKS